MYGGASLQGTKSFVLCIEVVLFSEATNELSLWEVGVLCSGCPLLRGNKCIITMGSGSPLFRLSSSQRQQMYITMGSGSPLFRSCPLLRGNKCIITWEVGVKLSSSQRQQMYYHYGKWESFVQKLSSSQRQQNLMYYHYGKWESFVVLFSEVTNVLSLWEVGVLCSEVVLFSEDPGSTVQYLQ